MSTENIAILGLAVAGLTALIALFAAIGQWAPFWSDRHVISAYGSLFIASDGRLDLAISVSNVGKRPTTIRFIQIQPPHGPSHSCPFLPGGPARLDVGDAVSTVVPRAVAVQLWRDASEIQHLEFYVVDSANKRHSVSAVGRSARAKSRL